MADFTAQDVKALRDSTGAGMHVLRRVALALGENEPNGLGR